jgi:hypothetical protein
MPLSDVLETLSKSRQCAISAGEKMQRSQSDQHELNRQRHLEHGKNRAENLKRVYLHVNSGRRFTIYALSCTEVISRQSRHLRFALK